ncbi:hypothetical protein CWR43_31020 [Rhizobium sullae]|uniref:Uncharacterized protein n=1 Tax=Rhizobium sullae TaxID=50338 RepID=A0A2N0D0P7_RHISU|nr:hypothetical protein CWR43_31020 [Rhizobium sullae]
MPPGWVQAGVENEHAAHFRIMPAGLIAMLLMPFGLDALQWRVVGFGFDLDRDRKDGILMGGDIGVAGCRAGTFR